MRSLWHSGVHTRAWESGGRQGGIVWLVEAGAHFALAETRSGGFCFLFLLPFQVVLIALIARSWASWAMWLVSKSEKKDLWWSGVTPLADHPEIPDDGSRPGLGQTSGMYDARAK